MKKPAKNKKTAAVDRRVLMPEDLGSITTRDAAAECEPYAGDLRKHDVAAVWAGVETMFRSGLYPAISFSLRRRGRVLLKRAIGYSRGGFASEGIEPELCTPDTPVCLFSASKAVTAMLIHKLAEQGALGLDQPVADYLPAYAARGKGGTTLRHLLAHTAGIPRLPMKKADPKILLDWDQVIDLLCAAAPASPSGHEQSYHALTAGYILGEVAQRATGRGLPQLLREAFARPMGLDCFRYGLAPADRPRAALNYATGPRTWFPASWLARRVLGVGFEEATEISNTPEFMKAVIPAGNLYATADDAGAFYQMLLDKGRWRGKQILQPETIAAAVKPEGPLRWDGSLRVPVRFSAGFVLGERWIGLYGPRCQQAFGHLGFMNILTWADPERDISVSLLSTGKTLSLDSIGAMAPLLAAIGRLPRKK